MTPEDDMHVTVAVCTFNRAALLDRTLDGFCGLEIPAGVTWEVLIVNNNSTDDTDAVVARYSSRLPIRAVFESRPGKSYAANRVVREAKGAVILWTDDDVLVEKDWIAAYVRAAKEWPDAAYFGGTVDPWFETEAPRWIDGNVRLLNEPYALAQHGNQVFPLADQPIVGANMATRTDIVKRFPFDVSLGPTGTRALRGEDTDLVGRMRSAGLTGIWVGPARVRHFIKSERLTRRYLWHWYGGLGSWVAHRENPTGEVSWLFGAPRWALKKYARLLIKFWFLTPFGGAVWIKSLRETALMRGYISETRRMRNSAPPSPARVAQDP
jgi:GT2 family glycosyltransferase